MSKRILISGSTGQLGSEIKSITSNYKQYEFIFKDRHGLDLKNIKNIKDLFQNNKYDYFINAAAYTSVDHAESDQENCYDINASALTYLGQYCNPECNIIHISSDYVYNITPGRPLKESDKTNPLGVYAKSKLQGEQNLLDLRSDSIVIRTSWVYSEYGNNFVKTMLKLGKTKDKLSIVSDQIGTPTYAKELAKCILDIIQFIENAPQDKDFGGIYNFSHLGATNWAEFAQEIFRLKNISCEIQSTTTESYNAPAHRPLWSVMSMDKIKNTFPIELKNWKDSLKECLLRLP